MSFISNSCATLRAFVELSIESFRVSLAQIPFRTLSVVAESFGDSELPSPNDYVCDSIRGMNTQVHHAPIVLIPTPRFERLSKGRKRSMAALDQDLTRHKRLREEDTGLLGSMSPKSQAEKMSIFLLGSQQRCVDDEFVQAYVGLYDDLLTPPASKMSMYDVGTDAVKALVARMEQQIFKATDPEELALNLTIMRILTRLEDNRATLVESGGIEVIIKAMASNEENEKILEQAAQLLGNIAFHKPGRHTLPRTDSLKRIAVKLEDLDREEGEDEKMGSPKEREPPKHENDHRDRVVSAGAMEQTLAAMRRHLTSRSVQRFGCRVILFIALDSTSRQRAIAQMGGIQTVMLAMTAHPESESCQTYACSCLNLLVRDPGVQHLVDHEAGIRGTLKMLETWAESEQVARVGCMALASLCHNASERKLYAASLRAIDLVIGFITNLQLRSNLQVQLQACYALWSLVTRCVQNQIEACDKGAVEATVASMLAHPTSPALQEYGCRVLGNLALSGDACQASVAGGGGVDAILAALSTHLHSPEVQGAGCLALGFIAANNAHTKALISDKGGVEAVATSGQMHQNSVEVRGCVDIALYSICGDAADSRATSMHNTTSIIGVNDGL